MAGSRKAWFKARYDAGLCSNCRRPRVRGDHKCTFHQMRDSLRQMAPSLWHQKYKHAIPKFLDWWYTRYKTYVRTGGIYKSLHQVAVDVYECVDTLYQHDYSHNAKPVDVLKMARYVRASDRKALNEHARIQAHAEDSPPQP